jgi:hypothetical protein
MMRTSGHLRGPRAGPLLITGWGQRIPPERNENARTLSYLNFRRKQIVRPVLIHLAPEHRAAIV